MKRNYERLSKMKLRWKNVMTCTHSKLTNYYETGKCPSPYCTWTEIRCAKCKAYIVRCLCGFENNTSLIRKRGKNGL